MCKGSDVDCWSFASVFVNRGRDDNNNEDERARSATTTTPAVIKT